MTIVWALARSGITATCAEARRLVCCGAVKVDGRRVEDIEHLVNGVVNVTVGKRPDVVVDTAALRTKHG